MAGEHLLGPHPTFAAAGCGSKLFPPGGPGIGKGVVELGRPNEGGEKGGGGEVGDGEPIAGQVSRRTQLGLDPIERRACLAATALGAGRVCAESASHGDSSERQHRAVDAARARGKVLEERPRGDAGLREELVKQRPADARTELHSERALELERAAALGLMAG